MSVRQDGLPDAIRVPSGNTIAAETVGVGEIKYECRERKDAGGKLGWEFVGPDAVLNDRSGKRVGRYYGPPATWEMDDGSKVTGSQLAVAPAGTGNIPLQLARVDKPVDTGALKGVRYIQRLATVGGVAPDATCDASAAGKTRIVRYQADYILWRAN